MATTKEVADGLFALVKEGKFSEAVNAYYAEDIVSTEPMGAEPVSHGIEAARGKNEWFKNSVEMKSLDVKGPFVTGDTFILEYDLKATNKQSGDPMNMREYAVYDVKDGKITHEKFFYIPA